MKKNGILRLLLAAALLVLVCAWSCGPAEGIDPLTYEVLPDGSGVQVTGCDPAAESVTIPAEHDGLPVVSVKEGAFLDCTELTEFRAEEGQETFCTRDGVLFTDKPVKTLVCFPAKNKHTGASYTVPEGVTVIGPYAFAAQGKLEYLHLPEGVKTLGDCAFAGLRREMCVFVPNSLTKIGEDLLQGQQDNLPFYGDWESAAAAYAKAHQIPFSGVWDPDKVKDTAGYTAPDLTDADDAPEVDPGRIVLAEEGQYSPHFLVSGYDLSEAQESAPSEIRLSLIGKWGWLNAPNSGYPVQTGVYGVGYTEEPAWIRGYAADGSVTGIRKVEGDFVFSLPGAVNAGVAGGKGTVLTALPYEPSWVSEPGVVSLECSSWNRDPDGYAFGIFAFMFREARLNFVRPGFLNMMTYYFGDADPDCVGDGNYPHYSYVIVSMHDPAMFHLTDCVGMNVDAMETLLEEGGLTMMAKTSYHVDQKTYPKKVLEAWQAVKEVMQGTYFPQDTEILPIKVEITGGYPSTRDQLIELSEAFATYDKGSMDTIVHEMVHAVDTTMGTWWLLPSPWLEGRAEYIGRKVCRKAGYTAKPYEEKYDWSFLSSEDREDFLRYFFESTNRQTTYPVGYYFIDYLSRTYGEDISQAIMKALMEKMSYAGDAMADFRDAVESVTEEGVFQNFVRDVVEKGKGKGK